MSGSQEWKIRQARLADLSAIARMEAIVWQEMAVDQATLTKRFRRFPAGFLLAEDKYTLGGFCMALRISPADLTTDRISSIGLDDHRTDGAALFLLGLTVNPLFRRRGIGTLLVQAEIKLATAISCQSVQLIANSYSLDLFAELGFGIVRPVENSQFDQVRDLMPAPTHLILPL